MGRRQWRNQPTEISKKKSLELKANANLSVKLQTAKTQERASSRKKRKQRVGFFSSSKFFFSHAPLPRMDKRCAGCSQNIEGQHLIVGKDFFHSNCFSCATCSTPLQGKAATRRNGSLICADCAGGSQCHRCKKTIQIGQPEVKMAAQKLSFHESCLVCAETGCGVKIPKDQLYISAKSPKLDIYCKNHTYV